jgi:preprotein translocase subunit SecG
MYQVIIVIHVLLGLGVIGLVMMQQGKGADAGASFGTGSAGSVFGAQGAASFLSRATAILATSFFITSLGLAVINGHKGAAYDLMSGDASTTEAPAVVEKKAEVQPEVPEIKATEVPKADEIKTVK